MGELPALEIMPKCGWVVRPTRRLGRVATRCLFINVSSQAFRKPMKRLLVPPAPGQSGQGNAAGTAGKASGGTCSHDTTASQRIVAMKNSNAARGSPLWIVRIHLDLETMSRL